MPFNVRVIVGLLAIPLAASISLPVRDTKCGVKGYRKNTESYFYDDSASLATAAACGSRCQVDSDCKSYAVGDGACQHFSVAVYVLKYPSSLALRKEHPSDATLEPGTLPLQRPAHIPSTTNHAHLAPYAALLDTTETLLSRSSPPQPRRDEIFPAVLRSARLEANAPASRTAPKGVNYTTLLSMETSMQ